MKVMISLPMNGKDDNEVKNEIQKIKNKLAELHIETVDNFITGDVPVSCQHPPLYFMSKSIELMSAVDAVFFHKDWRSARGCRIEREICRVYGVKILDWSFAFEDDANIQYKTRFYADSKELGEVDEDGNYKPMGVNVSEKYATTRKEQMNEIKDRLMRNNDNHIPHLD